LIGGLEISEIGIFEETTFMIAVASLNCMACDREVSQHTSVSHAHAIDTAGIEESEKGVRRNASVRGGFRGRSRWTDSGA
jgi:hypothetical protein